MTPVEKFCKIANEKFDLELDPATFKRNRPGYWQRRAGAWGWFIFEFNRSRDIGSTDSITELLKAGDALEFDGREFHVN